MPLDIVEADDLIVEGSVCSSSGDDCFDGENFSSGTLQTFTVEFKAKDNNPSIGFDSISSGTNRDWAIATLSAGAAGHDFLIQNETGTPVRIEPGTGNNLLRLDSDDEVGINTSDPIAPLHVVGNGSLTGVESVFRLDSVAAPQQIFRNTNTGDEWFFAMTADNQFKVSKNGTGKVEAKFFDTGNLTIAGTLVQGSDARAKTAVQPVDTAAILDAVAGLDVSTWEYATDPGVVHLGPMAQDFADAFGLGGTSTGIAAVDADGVALAAIQALIAENEELRAENDALGARLDALEAAVSGG